MGDLIVMAIEPEKKGHDSHIKDGYIYADCVDCCRFFTMAVSRGRLKCGGGIDAQGNK